MNSFLSWEVSFPWMTSSFNKQQNQAPVNQLKVNSVAIGLKSQGAGFWKKIWSISLP